MENGICICNIYGCHETFKSYNEAREHVLGYHGRDTHTEQVDKKDKQPIKQTKSINNILQEQSLYTSIKKRTNKRQNNTKGTKKTLPKWRNK